MDCQELKASLLNWFGSEIECRSTGTDYLTATLPLLKPNGDPIEIGIEPSGDRQWKLSDLGDTYSTLYLAGVDLNDEYVRAEEFRQIIKAHRIVDEQQELSVESSTDELPNTLFDFVQGVQSMLALQLTMRPKQSTRDFASVVAKFFFEHHTSFEIPAQHVDGKSGRWKFNFVLNHVRPTETLIKAVTASNENIALQYAERSIFEILDVQAIREADAVVITDDEGSREGVWTPRVLRCFEEWNVQALPFQGRRQDLIQLALKYAA